MKFLGRIACGSKYKFLPLLLLPIILVWGHALATTLNLSNTSSRTAYAPTVNTFSNGFDLASASIVLDDVANTAVVTVTTFGRNGSGDPDPDVIPGAGCAAGAGFCVTSIAGCPQLGQLVADSDPATDQNAICANFPHEGPGNDENYIIRIEQPSGTIRVRVDIAAGGASGTGSVTTCAGCAITSANPIAWTGKTFNVTISGINGSGLSLAPGQTVFGNIGAGSTFDGPPEDQIVLSATVPTTTTTTTTTTTIPVVPTAGNWGMMMLGLAFLGAMAWLLRARRSLR